MKKIFFLLITLSWLFSYSQKLNLTINGTSILEQKTIDSINYKKKHNNVSSILNTIKKFDSTLNNLGYITARLKEQKKLNDSTFYYLYKIGSKTKKIEILNYEISSENKKLLELTRDTITIDFSGAENWIQNKLYLLEKKGYSLAKLKLTNFKETNNILYAKLTVELNSKRKTDELIILGYDKFPRNYKHQFNRKIKNKIFNQDLVSKINDDFNNLRFITQIKYPEILFTEDKTKVFAYLSKAKPNKFDGYIGFSNDENQKIIFNGYLDLLLINTLNSGEEFKIFWKNDGNKQTLFTIKGELPFLFKTPLGIKSELNIFKQDSTFQNNKIDLNLGYSFSFNKKLYIGLQKTTSVDIQNSNTLSLNNYKNEFYTISYEYKKNNILNSLFPEKTNLFIRLGKGNRVTTLEKNKQFLTEIQISQLITLNKKNSVFLKNQTLFLKSDNYLTNELYRFGGINSIRGFRENSLQGNFFSGIITEYRYLATPTLFIHSISDFGYFEDKTTLEQNKILGLGIGFELLTNNGLLHLVYSNGSFTDQNIKLSNSIIQLSFKTFF